MNNTLHRKNEVKQLSEIDHVLQKSGMYLGDCAKSKHQKWSISDNKIKKIDVEYSPGLFKLFDEIISNSIDEALRTNFAFANKIDVVVDNNTIKITDNGRGIPVVEYEDGKTQAEIAFTSLRAGGNFTEEEFVSIGTHGLGSTLCNIMSKEFIAITADGKNKLTLVCKDNLNSIKSTITKSKEHFTSVQYTPDFDRFNGVNELNNTDINLIYKRLYDLSICFPNIMFTLNKKSLRQGNPNKAFSRYVNLYADEFVVVESNDYKVAVFPVEEPTNISFVNGIDTFNGGTHVEVVSNIIVNELLLAFKKKYKKLDIKASDVKNHIGFIIFTNKIKNCKFNSQTKEQITNKISDIKPVFSGLTSEGLFFRKILNNSSLIDPIIETKRLKLEAKERLLLKNAQKNAKKLKVPAHVPATGRNNLDKILFLSEGQSASGQLICVRDPEIHGSFPLKGKVLNTSSKKPSEMVKNKEIASIMSIVGLYFGKPAVNLNYNKIVLLTDEDHDGNAISALLMNFFIYWPELFIQNKIVLLRSPIILARKNKQIKRFYSLDDYYNESSKLSNWEITYIKGLGSLPESEYKKMIDEPMYVNVQLDNNATKNLDLVFGSDSNKRKDWLSI